MMVTKKSAFLWNLHTDIRILTHRHIHLLIMYIFWKILLHIGKVQPSDKTKKKLETDSDCTFAEFTLARCVCVRVYVCAWALSDLCAPFRLTCPQGSKCTRIPYPTEIVIYCCESCGFYMLLHLFD